MGYSTMVLDPDPTAPAGAIADRHLVAAYDDPAALAELGDACAVVTTEFENPPAAALAMLADTTLVRPAPRAVEIAQDRITEKRFIESVGVSVAPWCALVESTDLDDVARLGSGPLIVKTARLGYDGKGQRRVSGPTDVPAAWAELGGVACVVERAVDLVNEVSVVLARAVDGLVVCYPVVENRHRDGILDVTVMPAPVAATTASAGVEIASQIAAGLEYVGVLAVEFFVVADSTGVDQVLVNEIAPRPHNSGHWTLDVAQTSQFEQQVRAICGLSLGDPRPTRPAAAMVNLLGDLWESGEPNWTAAVTESTSLHLYGKTTPRPGRKMGHLTAWGSGGEVEALAVAARRRLGSSEEP